MNIKKKKMPIKELIKLKYPGLTDKEILAHILCKEVLINGERISYHLALVPADAMVELVKRKKYVSRGGIKLAYILNIWEILVKDKVFIDVGASTGGFTHCLLQHGAKFIYAVDVGYCQLDYTIRSHPLVKSMERTNIMQLEKTAFPVSPHAAVCDMSFRSVRGAAHHILSLTEEGWFVALVKPQFEWQQPASTFDGIIREEKDLRAVLGELIEELWLEQSFVTRVAVSPIKGKKGNKEFFFLIKRQEEVSKAGIWALTKDLLQG